MRDIIGILASVLGMSVVLCLGLATLVNANNSSETSSATKPDTQAQARPEVEKQRKQAEQQAANTVDKEAVAAIDDTEKAIKAIAANKTDEALADIERATGKVNILLARNPSTALIPVSVEVDVIDTAPQDTQAILDLAKDASRAVDDKDFPTARVLLHALMSEVRVRTYNLPLATYPAALQDAARLLDQKKTQEAKTILLTALNTLMAIDRTTPIPLLLAREAINEAQAKRQNDKNAAQSALERARNELQRSKELGYASNDPEYASLNDDISNLEKQLKGSGETMSVFSKFKEKHEAFVKRLSDRERHGRAA
jgi:hypothetical protein